LGEFSFECESMYAESPAMALKRRVLPYKAQLYFPFARAAGSTPRREPDKTLVISGLPSTMKVACLFTLLLLLLVNE